MSAHEHDSLLARGKSLEDAYFAEKDRQLSAAIRLKLTTEESNRLLAAAIGIPEQLAFKEIAQLGAGVDVIAALALLPLVEVAWCDGDVSAKEKAAVLKAAIQMNIAEDSPMYQFLQNWLDARPPRAAVDAWKAYVKVFVTTVEPATAIKIQEAVMGRAEKVAHAAGGFLGYSTISAAEHACLDDLDKAFG